MRVFDLNTGDNYALVPPARRKTAGLPAASAPARDADPSGRRLTCVCYDSASRVLACGQRDGRVTMFRHTGPRALHRGDVTTAADTKENNDEGNEGNGDELKSEASASNDSNDSDDSDSSPEDAWRVIATLDCGDVSGRLTRVCFGPQIRLLAAVATDGARLCVRVKLNDKVREGVSVVSFFLFFSYCFLLFPYICAISVDAVCVLCIGASRRGFRRGGSHRRFTRPRASQHHGTRHADHRRGRHVIALTGVELVAGGGTRGERSRRVQPSLVLRLVRLFSNCHMGNVTDAVFILLQDWG